MVLPDGQFRFLFTAKDYQASVAFYRDSLELPVDHAWDYGPTDQGTVFLAGKGMIEILARAPGTDYTRPQGTSILLQVDDADRWAERAKQKGLKVLEGSTSFPWGHRILRLADPDGITVSLFAVIPQEGTAE
jgi:predicted enzyme related to lactoylglutathione lyase